VARFEEGLEVVTRLLGSREPVTFEGRYYQLREALLRPAPRRPKGPPIVVGGNGPLKTLPLAARFADEWNAVFTSPAVVAERNARLDALLRERGRDPGSVRRSVMTGTALGKTRDEIERRKHGRSDADVAARGIVVGPYESAAEQVAKFEAAGAQRVMLQWLDLDDLDGVKRLARVVVA
jgi:alkanesulfonate monooxygenase SsuD/methylene tetrahydromethanopterin reductase-like flavin-dependent oxidoreductase (luciferase family)